jgi:hypothetical protein
MLGRPFPENKSKISFQTNSKLSEDFDVPRGQVSQSNPSLDRDTRKCDLLIPHYPIQPFISRPIAHIKVLVRDLLKPIGDNVRGPNTASRFRGCKLTPPQ